MKSKVCFVTGGRPDYGILYWVMKQVLDSPEFEFQLIVTGQHLSQTFGYTVNKIESDGFPISARIDIHLSSDTPAGISKSIAKGVYGFAEAYETLKPDLLVLMGDRYELLAAAQAALIARIPIAHISGGDTTEGAFDEAIRHSITKMSHIHFATNEVAARRIRQLGEDPKFIFVSGNPGLDWINKIELLDRPSLEDALDFKLQKQNFLVTFHPVTLEKNTSENQMHELLSALSEFPNVGIILTTANSDTDGRVINSLITKWVTQNKNAKAFDYLGQLRYLSLLKQVNAIIGNSSSGLAEAPSFKTPTLNVGDRQKGRLRASSVIDCIPEKQAIVEGIQQALQLDCSAVVNPYGQGNSAQKIVSTLTDLRPVYGKLLKKHFYDLDLR
jgi:UDP-hydrolysing UDP-N-acetyl-D-glucosamine 2-epimerase